MPNPNGDNELGDLVTKDEVISLCRALTTNGRSANNAQVLQAVRWLEKLRVGLTFAQLILENRVGLRFDDGEPTLIKLPDNEDPKRVPVIDFSDIDEDNEDITLFMPENWV